MKNGKGLGTLITGHGCEWMRGRCGVDVGRCGCGGGRRGGDIGGGEGQCPSINSCTINLRSSFLLFKLSTLNLVNIWGPT